MARSPLLALLALVLALTASAGCSYARRGCPHVYQPLVVDAGQAPQRIGSVRDADSLTFGRDGDVAIMRRWRPRGGERGRFEISVVLLAGARRLSRRKLPRGSMRTSGLVLADGGDWLVYATGSSARIERVDDETLEAELEGARSILAVGTAELAWMDHEATMHLWTRAAGSWQELATGPAPAVLHGGSSHGAFVLGDGDLLLLRQQFDVVTGAQTHAVVVREGSQLRVLPEPLQTHGLARVDATRVVGEFDGRYCEWELGDAGLGPPRCSWTWRFDPGARVSAGAALWVWQDNRLELVERSSGAAIEVYELPACMMISAVVVRGDRALIGVTANPLAHWHG